jgi:hypothetical protein
MNFAYIAGFFDGEGSISTYVSDNRKRKSRKPYGGEPAPKPSISMSQSDPRILYEIRDFLGYGSIYQNQLHIRSKRSVIHFADHVGPHLRVKKRRVMIAREMALLIDDHNKPASLAVFNQRVKLSKEIRDITRRTKERRRPWQR